MLPPNPEGAFLLQLFASVPTAFICKNLTDSVIARGCRSNYTAIHNDLHFVSESERSGYKILCFWKHRKHKGLSRMALISTKYAIVKAVCTWYDGNRTADEKPQYVVSFAKVIYKLYGHHH